MYAVLFEDNDDLAHLRQQHMPEHLAFLEKNVSAIHAAGPLKDAESGLPAGGLWLVEAENPRAAWSIIKADPFWPTGLRKSVRLLEWTRVFADGARQI